MRKKLLLFVLLSIVIFFLISFIQNNFQEKYKIIHISSYHPDYHWEVDMEKGIKQAFIDNNIEYNYRVFYMDSKNHTDKEWLKSRASYAINLIKKEDPDLVMISDDNAVKHVAVPLKDTKYKLVFLGVNNDSQNYGFPAKNITGVIERTLIKDNIDLLKYLQPNVENIVLITDNSNTSALIINRFKEIESDLPVKVSNIHRISTVQEWKDLTLKYQKNTDALLIALYHTLRDDFDNHASSSNVMGWTAAKSNIPEVGLWNFLVKDGGLCSVALTGYGQGYLAAAKGSLILKGKSPGDIKVEKSSESIIYINKKRAKALGINIQEDFPFEKFGAKKIIYN